MFAYSSVEEAIGHNIAEVAADKEIAQMLLTAMQTEGRWRGELHAPLRDGTTIDFLLSANLVRDEESVPIAMMGSVIDITERKRAEEALRRSLEETVHGQRLLLALSQAAQAVERARTPDEVYQTVGDEVTKLGYHAIVFTPTADQTHLTMSHLTFESDLLRAAEKLTGLSAQTFQVPLAQAPVFQRILTKGETTFNEPVADFMAGGLPKPLRQLAGRLAALLGLEQSITAPLTVGGQRHGLLMVTGAGLTEADVPAMSAFANQAAIAIENAQLYEAEQERRHIAESTPVFHLAPGSS